MTLTLDREQARRLAVLGQLLAGPAPDGIPAVVERLGAVQRDPTAAVAPTEYIVLWSRLGDYDRADLDRLLYEEQELTDYWVHIVPSRQLGLQRPAMERHPHGDGARARYTREWLAANASFRRYVLGALRRQGPLRSRDLEDRAAVPWRTGGWNDGKNVARMLDTLWFAGRIAIVGRQGRERVWDLAERARQPLERLAGPELARRLVDQQLKATASRRRLRSAGRSTESAPAGRIARSQSWRMRRSRGPSRSRHCRATGTPIATSAARAGSLARRSSRRSTT